jgi:hypothetical protein
MPKATPKALRQFPPLGPEQKRIALPSVIPHAHPYVAYFFRNGNRVKIGATKGVLSRLGQFGLTRDHVALLLDGGYQLEGSLHAYFAAQRVDRTEWFRLDPTLFASIKKWRSQPAVAALGGAEHEARWEDLEQIAGRVGLPLSVLRTLSKDETWPASDGVARGQRRLYYRNQVDTWLERHADQLRIA